MLIECGVKRRINVPTGSSSPLAVVISFSRARLGANAIRLWSAPDGFGVITETNPASIITEAPARPGRPLTHGSTSEDFGSCQIISTEQNRNHIIRDDVEPGIWRLDGSNKKLSLSLIIEILENMLNMSKSIETLYY